MSGVTVVCVSVTLSWYSTVVWGGVEWQHNVVSCQSSAIV
jgi:hypothetical protein